MLAYSFRMLSSVAIVALLECCRCRATASASFLVQLDSVGAGVRVRIAPPGCTIVDPPFSAFAPNATSNFTVGPAPPPLVLSNGNVRVYVSAAGQVEITRVSDATSLLNSSAILWGKATNGSRPQSFSAQLSFYPNFEERVWGFGQHTTGSVALSSFFRLFEDSQNYSVSHGSDSSIPWFSSSIGYGFLFNSPGYGFVNFSAAGTTWFANATKNIDFWVVTTPSEAAASTGSILKHLLARYVDVAGHAPPMPTYSTGFIQSKNRYRNQVND